MKERFHLDIDSASVTWSGCTEITDDMTSFMEKLCKQFGLEILHWEGSKRDETVCCVFSPEFEEEDAAENFFVTVEKMEREYNAR